MSAWTSTRPPKWDWRAFLTEDEAAQVEAADRARAEWQRLRAAKAFIQNRAIQRAKFAASRTSSPTSQNPKEA